MFRCLSYDSYYRRLLNRLSFEKLVTSVSQTEKSSYDYEVGIQIQHLKMFRSGKEEKLQIIEVDIFN